MNETAVIAPVRKIVRVKAPIAHTFEVFTGGLTRWWPYDYGVGKLPIQKVLIEPRLGGRWLEISEDGTETTVATHHHLGAAASPRHALADKRAMEARCRDEIRSRHKLHPRWTRRRAGGTRAPQVRD